MDLVEISWCIMASLTIVTFSLQKKKGKRERVLYQIMFKKHKLVFYPPYLFFLKTPVGHCLEPNFGKSDYITLRKTNAIINYHLNQHGTLVCG